MAWALVGFNSSGSVSNRLAFNGLDPKAAANEKMSPKLGKKQEKDRVMPVPVLKQFNWAIFTSLTQTLLAVTQLEVFVGLLFLVLAKKSKSLSV